MPRPPRGDANRRSGPCPRVYVARRGANDPEINGAHFSWSHAGIQPSQPVRLFSDEDRNIASREQELFDSQGASSNETSDPAASQVPTNPAPSQKPPWAIPVSTTPRRFGSPRHHTHAAEDTDEDDQPIAKVIHVNAKVNAKIRVKKDKTKNLLKPKPTRNENQDDGPIATRTRNKKVKTKKTHDDDEGDGEDEDVRPIATVFNVNRKITIKNTKNKIEAKLCTLCERLMKGWCEESSWAGICMLCHDWDKFEDSCSSPPGRKMIRRSSSCS